MARQEGKNVYKDTLNLPQTTFEMKAGLVQKEPALLEGWRQQNLYARVREARDGSPRYVLHDGPPYANGSIHMGHLLNKVLKDFVVRYKTMRGFDTPYIPGWDCHGQPIEAKVVDEIGRSVAATMDRMAIRQRCQQYAQKHIDLQREEFERLGGWGEYARPYVTMAPAYEADVLEVFARMVGEEIVYRQLKPVHWSIEYQTALADAELEYQDREDTSVYVLFEVADAHRVLRNLFAMDPVPTEPLALMIWTTTPWTLPANLAVAAHPQIEYALVRYVGADDRLRYAVVARELVERVFGQAGDRVREFAVVHTVTGEALFNANVAYHHPLLPDKTCPVVTAEYVTLEDGTGLVHTAPGHGVEDYQTGLRYDLPIYCPVQADGTFDDTAPAFLRGRSVWEGNERVCQELTQRGAMFRQHRFVHSYPHDWRSKKPTIFRATEQWFVSVDRPMKTTGRTLRQMAMDVARPDSGVRFVPEWGRNRLAGMLESRPDWCISRQRNWGLPIPAFRNRKGQILLTQGSVRAVKSHFAAYGSDSWFTRTPAQILAGYNVLGDPDVPNAADFAPDQLTKEMDIFDVWFESGSSWFGAAVARGLVSRPPVQLYLEGSDQHRGWFQLSLLCCLAAAQSSPFETVLTHGFVVDENGRKMSKSEGNVVNVQDELSRRGADIMRLWVSSVNYQDDVRTSEALIAPLEEAYRKIRNTLRYAMGACADFDPAVHAVEVPPHSVDGWMRLELNALTAGVLEAYDAFEFHRVYRLIYEFCTVEASSIYMAAVKDRLYCELPDSPRRRATQTVLHELLLTVTRLLAPILPFTADEAWQHIPNRPADLPDSVHLALMPEPDRDLAQAYAVRPVARDEATFPAEHLQAGPATTWERLLEIRDEGLRRLEALRNAGVKNPLDAEVIFRVPANDAGHQRLLELYLAELEDLLGVGYARVEAAPPVDRPGRIEVEVADAREKYPRCARSWKRRPDVGSDAEYPDLSARDAAVMRALKAGRP